MAIGKVGSFATVEPALVDFGAMAERNIDKIKAEEQAKAAAKAAKEKADKDRLKDYDVPDELGYTGIPEYDYSAQMAFKKFFKLATEAKLNGDEANLMKYTAVLKQYKGRYDDAVKAIPGIYSAAEKDPTVDDDWVNDTITTLTKLQENGHLLNVDDVDKPTISFKNEDGTFTDPQNWDEYLKTLTVPVRKVDLIDKTKKVLSTIKPSVTKDGSYAVNKEIKDINSEESKSQVEAIKANVDMWVSNNDFMYSFYKMERSKNQKLPYKTTGWTEDEVNKARKFYTEYLIDAYNEEVKAGFGRPGSSGGGGGGGNLNVSEVLPLSRVTISDSNNNLIAGKDVKGRIYSTNDAQAGIEVAGKRIKGFYAGNDGSFYFSAADPTSAGYGGVSGRNLGVEWVYPDTKNYGDIVNQAVAAFKNFGVTDEKSLASFLRGENQQINTSGY